jgi:predicted nucleic acid-binding protein
MAEQTLVDTDILIDAAKEQKDAVSFPQGEESHRILAVSVVTEMELVVGCRLPGGGGRVDPGADPCHVVGCSGHHPFTV